MGNRDRRGVLAFAFGAAISTLTVLFVHTAAGMPAWFIWSATAFMVALNMRAAWLLRRKMGGSKA